MLQQIGLAHLGIAVGLLYWPAEAILHAYLFSNGSFLENLLDPDPNEIWMRLLISAAFIGFGFYAHQAVRSQQQLQSQIKKRGERLQQIIDCTYDAYICMNEMGIITGWNRSAEQLFGWPAHRIIGKPIDTIIPKDMRDNHRKGMQQYLKSSIAPSWLYKPALTKALHRNGLELPVMMVITPIESDGAQEFFAFIRAHHPV